MSELKTYKMVDEKYCTDCVCVIPSEVYLKSEADKVFAELKKANNDKDDWCLNTLKENRHHKYKRCMAMTMWCKSKSEIYNEFAADASEYMPSYEAQFHSKAVLYQKWAMRWLKIAELFKEAK